MGNQSWAVSSYNKSKKRHQHFRQVHQSIDLSMIDEQSIAEEGSISEQRNGNQELRIKITTEWAVESVSDRNLSGA